MKKIILFSVFFLALTSAGWTAEEKETMQSKQINSCERIGYPQWRDDCFESLGSILSYSVCTKITDKNRREACIKAHPPKGESDCLVNADTADDCLYALKNATRDISLCKKIKDHNTKKECYIGPLGKNDNIALEFIAKQQQDKSICDLVEGSAKNSCIIAVGMKNTVAGCEAPTTVAEYKQCKQFALAQKELKTRTAKTAPKAKQVKTIKPIAPKVTKTTKVAPVQKLPPPTAVAAALSQEQIDTVNNAPQVEPKMTKAQQQAAKAKEDQAVRETRQQEAKDAREAKEQEKADKIQAAKDVREAKIQEAKDAREAKEQEKADKLQAVKDAREVKIQEAKNAREAKEQEKADKIQAAKNARAAKIQEAKDAREAKEQEKADKLQAVKDAREVKIQEAKDAREAKEQEKADKLQAAKDAKTTKRIKAVAAIVEAIEPVVEMTAPAAEESPAAEEITKKEEPAIKEIATEEKPAEAESSNSVVVVQTAQDAPEPMIEKVEPPKPDPVVEKKVIKTKVQERTEQLQKAKKEREALAQEKADKLKAAKEAKKQEKANKIQALKDAKEALEKEKADKLQAAKDAKKAAEQEKAEQLQKAREEREARMRGKTASGADNLSEKYIIKSEEVDTPTRKVKMTVTDLGCTKGFGSWVEPPKKKNEEIACDKENVERFATLLNKCMTADHNIEILSYDMNKDGCVTCDDLKLWRKASEKLYESKKRSTNGRALILKDCKERKF